MKLLQQSHPFASKRLSLGGGRVTAAIDCGLHASDEVRPGSLHVGDRFLAEVLAALGQLSEL